MRILGVTAALLVVLVGAQIADAQEYYGFHRTNKVGPRPHRIDEEGFLNIFSYRLPIESVLPFTRADRGYQISLGSLDQTKLWYEQELRLRGKMSEDVAIMVYGVAGVDFDSDYVFIQPSVEVRVAGGFEILVPTSVEFDKGFWNFGLGGRYRAPEHGIEYLQISWLRAMALFGSHKINPDESKVNDPADAFEFQGMGRIGSLGTSRLKATWYAPSSFTYGDLGQTEEWEGAYVHWIHRADLSESTPLFLEFTLDTAKEELRTDEPDLRKDEYKGERDYYQFRVETHLNLKEDSAERVRLGLNFDYFFTDEELPNRPKYTNRIYRRELTLFGGYRYGFTDTFSLDSIVFLTGRSARHNYPYNDHLDDREADAFQAKINFFLRWDFSKDAWIVLTPSFELDTFGWGGGGLQVYYTF